MAWVNLSLRWMVLAVNDGGGAVRKTAKELLHLVSCKVCGVQSTWCAGWAQCRGAGGWRAVAWVQRRVAVAAASLPGATASRGQRDSCSCTPAAAVMAVVVVVVVCLVAVVCGRWSASLTYSSARGNS
jgi:hypothetical protein